MDERVTAIQTGKPDFSDRDVLFAWMNDPNRRPMLQGVLNVTPDSFSDGGRWLDASAAVEHARRMVADGAAVIDVGGESTRPGADPVSPAEQIRRVIPVIRAAAGLPAAISIDTTSAEVAAAAIDAGASIVNDVSAGRADAKMLPLVADRQVAVILMHMQRTPADMQANPSYEDVVREVDLFLRERIFHATSVGVRTEQTLIDVGIGFGKTTEHNLQLLRGHATFRGIGRPIVLGTSRKRFIGELTRNVSGATGEPAASDPADRVIGTAVTVAWGVHHGADLFRVHDVHEMRQAMQMAVALKQ